MNLADGVTISYHFPTWFLVVWLILVVVSLLFFFGWNQ